MPARIVRGAARSRGAVAQLGERYNGIVEVVGSIPSGSTIFIKGLANDRWVLFVVHAVANLIRRHGGPIYNTAALAWPLKQKGCR